MENFIKNLSQLTFVELTTARRYYLDFLILIPDFMDDVRDDTLTKIVDLERAIDYKMDSIKTKSKSKFVS